MDVKITKKEIGEITITMNAEEIGILKHILNCAWGKSLDTYLKEYEIEPFTFMNKKDKMWCELDNATKQFSD